MNLRFRQATDADVALIHALAEKIWRAHYPSIITQEQISYMLELMYSETSLQRQLQEGHCITLLYLQDRAIGYFSISSADEYKFLLHKFYLDTAVHYQGLGKLMMDELINQLPATAEQIELFVNRENIKAINFYFRHGFTIARVADNHIGNNYWMNDFVMRRVLKK